ncbi:unnamed protein product [Bursaphelenchus okinawaensis]|uniref:Uncharacterized protein n=1 Tax=Bursaphelenchus okinawaensis TaxID=465554 RepID=A0A811JR24_9BILA|nr:unnamed protein product [Bursaphelenchus okinawaensis]CAG9078265.1 unnamed protein product [Bursaphelenchus okinawaensis]
MPPRQECTPEDKHPITIKNDECKEFNFEVAIMEKDLKDQGIRFKFEAKRSLIKNNVTVEVWFEHCLGFTVSRERTNNARFLIRHPSPNATTDFIYEDQYFEVSVSENADIIEFYAPRSRYTSKMQFDCGLNLKKIEEGDNHTYLSVPIGFRYDRNNPTVFVKFDNSVYYGKVPKQIEEKKDKHLHLTEPANTWVMPLVFISASFVLMLAFGAIVGSYYKFCHKQSEPNNEFSSRKEDHSDRSKKQDSKKEVSSGSKTEDSQKSKKQNSTQGLGKEVASQKGTVNTSKTTTTSNEH